jgi:hypothetical protein
MEGGERLVGQVVGRQGVEVFHRLLDLGHASLFGNVVGVAFGLGRSD